MRIKEIIVRNFKSFKELKVELGKFNVIVGSNASGKSNFVYIFDFIRDITTSGLDNAVSLQGDIEYLRNINIGGSKDFYLSLIFETDFGRIIEERSKEKFIGLKVKETKFELSLSFRKRTFNIIKDKVTQKGIFVEGDRKNEKVKEKELGKGKLTFSRKNNELEVNIKGPKSLRIKEEKIIPPFLKESKMMSRPLMSDAIFFIPFALDFVSIFDFDPKLSKEASRITGKAELERDGRNISIILRNIIEDNKKRGKLLNLIEDILPFVEDLDIEKFADRSLLFTLREIYTKNQYLPASLISDGTINITALILALYFEKKPVVIIEEPERNIHPYLISRVVEMMKDVSKKKQIITTTHNPEIVKYAGLENILLISRDEEGFSIISKPANKNKIKKFLENELGIDELYIQNLLDIS